TGARTGEEHLHSAVARTRRKRQHSTLAQALRGAASARKVAKHLRRVLEDVTRSGKTRNTQHEKETDLDSTTGDHRDGGLHRNWRRTGDASVELAAADVVRMAANYLLAGCRTAGSVPDSVRRR